jgi:hypothetical protein
MNLLRKVARVKNPRPRVSFSGIVLLTQLLAKRLPRNISKQHLLQAARVMTPTLVALTCVSAAHAQGTMDFSGAQTLMTTFNTRFAYVSISRASHDTQIYTNDAALLTSNLSHDITKSSALEAHRTADLNPQHSPMPELSLNLGIDVQI